MPVQMVDIVVLSDFRTVEMNDKNAALVVSRIFRIKYGLNKCRNNLQVIIIAFTDVSGHSSAMAFHICVVDSCKCW